MILIAVGAFVAVVFSIGIYSAWHERGTATSAGGKSIIIPTQGNQTSTSRNMTQQIALSLNDRAYSEAFVQAEIATTVPFQIRAMRKQQGWTQGDLAKQTGQAQKVISDFENPDKGPKSIASLLKVAAAFDVALIVRFAPYSELVEWSASLSKAHHFAPSRTKDKRLRALQRAKAATVRVRITGGVFPKLDLTGRTSVPQYGETPQIEAQRRETRPEGGTAVHCRCSRRAR